MIFLIFSFFLKFIQIYEIPENFFVCDNPKYIYKVDAIQDNDLKIKEIEIFDKNYKIFSFKTNDENGFYFSDDLKYAAGIKNNNLNFYKYGKIIKSFNINNFSGGHFSKNKFVAKVKGGVFVFDENEKKFYKDLIDIYYLNDGKIEFYENKIIIKNSKYEKIINAPTYIRKISVSDNILSYGTKKKIYIFNISNGNFKEIEIDGNLTFIFSDDEFVLASSFKNGNSLFLIFDKNGNKIYEEIFDGFISRIYKEKNKIYILKDKSLFEFEIK